LFPQVHDFCAENPVPSVHGNLSASSIHLFRLHQRVVLALILCAWVGWCCVFFPHQEGHASSHSISLLYSGTRRWGKSREKVEEVHRGLLPFFGHDIRGDLYPFRFKTSILLTARSQKTAVQISMPAPPCPPPPKLRIVGGS
jgi:hypothetical protein